MEIEVWADLVCPWCFIGKRRLDEALAGNPQRASITVVHRAFQLDPAATSDGLATVAMLAEKYGISIDQAVDMMSDVSDTAAGVGLTYRLAETVSGNTADAHRLVLWAQERGRGAELLEALFSGYFERALPIFSAEDLCPFVAAVGLDPAEAATLLATEAFQEQVARDQVLARHLGARGVPFYVADRSLALSGAQPAAAYEAWLSQGVERSTRES